MSFAMELCHERRAMNDRIRTGREASTELREHGAEEHVDVQPVRLKADVHVRWSRFEAPLQAPSQAGGPGIAFEGVLRAVRPFVLPTIVVGVPFSFVAGGEWLGVALAMTIASVMMRNMARGITFNFGDGFLAFRKADLEQWPRGVQEEYDVRYSWPANGSLSAGRSSPSR